MSNLINIEIGEIGTTITGKTPLSACPEDFGDEYMFITPSDNFDDKTIYITNRYLSSDGLKKLKNKTLPAKSVLVSCIGSAMGKVTMNYSISITNQQINSIIVNSKYDSDYIYYILKNNYKLLRNASSGSTALPMLNKTDFDKLKISIHKEKFQQQKIAKVLSDLDAKIELNNKINSELEAMAKTLYDYWFVQFDFPFDFARSKPVTLSEVEVPYPLEGCPKDGVVNSKPYKTSGGKMVWNEELKREIPEGWEVKKIKEIAKTGSGGTPLKSKKEFYENGDIPWINSGEVNEPFIISTKKFITQKGLAGSSAKLFPKGTILMAMYGATAGQVSLIDIEACTNQAVCGIIPNDLRLVPYVKFELHQLYEYLISLSTGSARDNLSQDKIKELYIVMPQEDIIEKFYKISNSSFEKTLMNLKENQQLSSLRDWLLPMLMNGQVRVGDEAKVYKMGEEVLGLDGSYREVAEDGEKYGNKIK